jgi:hypothetical protein
LATAKTQSDILTDINNKIGGILGFLAVRDLKGDVSKMLPRLKEMGLDYKMMALVTGVSENAIAIRLSRMKKKSPKKTAKSKKVSAPKAPAEGGPESSEVNTDAQAE